MPPSEMERVLVPKLDNPADYVYGESVFPRLRFLEPAHLPSSGWYDILKPWHIAYLDGKGFAD